MFNHFKTTVMKITTEKSLSNFEFWSGAKDSAAKLTCEQLDQVDDMLEDFCPEGMDEGEINDLFWFDFDTVCNWLGYESEEMLDFCNEFESEEREIEFDGELLTLEVLHEENRTAIACDHIYEEMDVENGESVSHAIARFEKMLRENEEDEDAE